MFAQKATVINAYGPTEATVCTTTNMYNKNLIAENIGKPIKGAELFILSKDLKLVPDGVSGELYIGGYGLARGYLNNPVLTSISFIKNPFLSKSIIAYYEELGVETRLFKTGDLVCKLPNGDIKFLGREDNQIKLRGFRINLNEIEQAILTHSNILSCAVIMRKDDNNSQILAYYVPKNSSSISKISSLEIRAYLTSILPNFMIPAVFIEVTEIPLTNSDKIDYKELNKLALVYKIENKIIIQPSNELEQELFNIWSEAFGRNDFGIDDSFFELGGHSLIAAQLIMKINVRYNINCSFDAIFSNPTISQLALFVEQNRYSTQQLSDITVEKL